MSKLSGLLEEMLDEESPEELLEWAEEEYPEFMEAIDFHVEQSSKGEEIEEISE